MEEVTKQAEKLQHETNSKSISEDLQEGVLSSTETSLNILESLTNVEEGFQFATNAELV